MAKMQYKQGRAAVKWWANKTPPPTGTPTPPGTKPPAPGTPTPPGYKAPATFKSTANATPKPPMTVTPTPPGYKPPATSYSGAEPKAGAQYYGPPGYGPPAAAQAAPGAPAYTVYLPYVQNTPNPTQTVPTAPGAQQPGAAPGGAPPPQSDMQVWNEQVFTRGGKIFIRAGEFDAARKKLKEYGYRWESGFWIGRDAPGQRRVAYRNFTPQGIKYKGGGGGGNDRPDAPEGNWYSRLVNWRM